GAALAPSWLMARNPRSSWYALSEGALNLQARSVGFGDNGNPSFLARRQQHQNATASTSVVFRPVHDRAGGRTAVELRRRAGPGDPAAGTLVASAPLPGDGDAPVLLKIEAEGARYR